MHTYYNTVKFLQETKINAVQHVASSSTATTTAAATSSERDSPPRPPTDGGGGQNVRDGAVAVLLLGVGVGVGVCAAVDASQPALLRGHAIGRNARDDRAGDGVSGDDPHVAGGSHDDDDDDGRRRARRREKPGPPPIKFNLKKRFFSSKKVVSAIQLTFERPFFYPTPLSLPHECMNGEERRGGAERTQNH